MDHAVLYGLHVASELPLYQGHPAAGTPDLIIRLGDPIAADHDVPPGELVLHLVTDRQLYSSTRHGGSYILRFYGTCDFVLDADLTHVTVHLVEGADPAVVGVLAAGTMMSFVLILRGYPVLHASAVQIGDAALAFIGASGMGKSTSATLMCADGARLITDDVLRLGLDGDHVTCHLGATELRLRRTAGDLAAMFEEAPAMRVTGDARDAIRMQPATADGLPLAGIVVPLPDRTGTLDHPELTRLGEMEALMMLLRFPRIAGWEDEQVNGRQFQQLGDIVRRVPVHLARLPWGPPFSTELPSRLRDALGLSRLLSEPAQVRAAASTAAR